MTNNKKMFVFTLGGRKKSRFQVRRGTDQSLKAFKELETQHFLGIWDCWGWSVAGPESSPALIVVDDEGNVESGRLKLYRQKLLQ